MGYRCFTSAMFVGVCVQTTYFLGRTKIMWTTAKLKAETI